MFGVKLFEIIFMSKTKTARLTRLQRLLVHPLVDFEISKNKQATLTSFLETKKQRTDQEHERMKSLAIAQYLRDKAKGFTCTCGRMFDDTEQQKCCSRCQKIICVVCLNIDTNGNYYCNGHDVGFYPENAILYKKNKKHQID